MNKPGIPKGTRDFSTAVMARRNHIFQTIRSVFELHGYQPLETPSMEDIETLTGKYGEEGDQLIFRILDSGDYLKEVSDADLQQRNLPAITRSISGKALRYDLTVPFARYVVMNRHEITFPFRRYQIQPVWRADRPQKGRYREFYQCDVDVIGSTSLLCEVDLVQVADEVLSRLGIRSVIKLNNRKVLSGMAEVAGVTDRMMEMTIALDKLDKIGAAGVIKELNQRNFSAQAIEVISSFFNPEGTTAERLQKARTLLAGSVTGSTGLHELQFVIEEVEKTGLQTALVEFDWTLARGLNYYTGAIFEIKALDATMGSISGGGRYDDLTGIFGLPGVSGVGISFGADRLYDVMNELQLFPASLTSATRLLFAHFGQQEASRCLQLLRMVHQAGIAAELYPDADKLKKQFKYADDKGIPYVAVVGSDEMAQGTVSLKDMRSGEQQVLTPEQLIEKLTG